MNWWTCAAAVAATALMATTALAEARPVARPEVRASAAAEPTAPDAGTMAAARSDAVPAPAPVAAEVAPIEAPTRGPETNLPLPRYVSLKVAEANVRRGPSLTHRIDWVFLRRDMPLQVVAEYGHWRRVIDREGLGGWVHYSLLSGVRTVIIDEDLLELHLRSDAATPVTARLEAGVIARLGECGTDWCRLSAGGYRGWAPKAAVWGVDAGEVRD